MVFLLFMASHPTRRWAAFAANVLVEPWGKYLGRTGDSERFETDWLGHRSPKTDLLSGDHGDDFGRQNKLSEVHSGIRILTYSH